MQDKETDQVDDQYQRAESVEAEVATEKPKGQATVFQSFVTNINIMVGTGTLLLPFLLLQTGIWLGIVCFVFFSIMNTLLIVLIFRVSKELNLNGFDELCNVGFSGGANLVNGALVFALFGPVVSCFIIVGDMAVSVAGGSTNPQSGTIRLFTIIGGSLLIVPIVLQKRLSALKYVSPLAFIALLTFIIVLIVKTVQNPDPHHEFKNPQVGIELFAMIPCAFLSLCSHLNYYQIRENMADPQKVVVVYGSSISFASVIYILVAWLGLTLYGSETQSNVLVNVTRSQAGDVAGQVIQYMYLIIPLLTVPILYITQKQFYIEMFENITKKKSSSLAYYVLTMVLYACEVVVALLVNDLGVAYALLASTSVCLIVAVLPSYIGLRYAKKDKCFYATFLIFSITVFSMALVANTIKLVNSGDKATTDDLAAPTTS